MKWYVACTLFNPFLSADRCWCWWEPFLTPLQQTAFWKHSDKRRNCSKRAISPLATMYSTFSHRLPFQLLRFSIFWQNMFKVVCFRIVVWGKGLMEIQLLFAANNKSYIFYTKASKGQFKKYFLYNSWTFLGKKGRESLIEADAGNTFAFGWYKSIEVVLDLTFFTNFPELLNHSASLQLCMWLDHTCIFTYDPGSNFAEWQSVNRFLLRNRQVD